ncbi:MAG TPA: Hpt domain-containing protein [Candidatus Baltobacteraceae bacterium]|nr:Hpt domain-containing protein [Candidatus Baltobacteraceae bacterium]
MNGPNQESVELFLQEASENLQYLREYAGLLQEPSTKPEDLEKLYIAAHTLAGTSASYGFPHFSEVAAKMAHIFHYAMNATLTPDMHGPLTEFLSDAISVLEFDLLQISTSGVETTDDIAQFKQRYAFAFPAAPSAEALDEIEAGSVGFGEPVPEVFAAPSLALTLPEDAEVPDEVLEFFIPEAEEHLQAVTECLLALEGNPNADDIHRLFRSIHTVKGSAAQVGLHRLSAVAHRVEDLIGRLRDGALQPSAEIVDLCLQSVDVLRKFLTRQWSSDGEMAAAVDPLLTRIGELAPEEIEEEADETQTAAPVAQNAASDGAPLVAAARPAGVQPLPQAKSVRISLERLDRMMNAVGELVINRTRMLGRLSELAKLVEVLTFSKSRLSGKVSEFQEKHEFTRISSSLVPGSQAPQMDTFRPRAAARAPIMSNDLLEFSELEMDRYDDVNILSRSLTEISADVSEVLTQLEGFMGRVDTDIDEFTKLAHRLQDEITAARMVPIGNLYTRLSRTVRDAAQSTGKPVDLVLEGAETELDNNIIQHISDPLIHLVRNAVAHGIEDAATRRRAGKPEKGRISVRAYHRGNHIFIEVEDDGRGIDYERVRQGVIDSGAVSPVAAAELTERELREFLFRPGFSTASSTSELAGRGVGLDVVRANVHSLNGEIEVRSEKGHGACFTVKVPLTLIISQALFVRCGTSVFALPLAVVEEIRRLKPAEIEDVGGKLLTRVRDVVTEVVRLDLQLALPPLEPLNGYFHMVIVKVAGKHVGVVVEEVLGKDEIVIKNLGDYLRRVKLFPGTTIASDGSLILLIDLNRLVAADTAERHALPASSPAARVFAPGAEAVAAGSIPSEAVDAIENDRVVVVADDSISVRKFVGRMLEKAGFRVKLASDGLEASEIVAQVGCHLVITDLEMPRMNGYELMAHLRQDPVTRRIPVLVVTSRAGAKHRDRAMKEGASGFLTKPVQEDQLIATVESLIGSETPKGRPAGGVPLPSRQS